MSHPKSNIGPTGLTDASMAMYGENRIIDLMNEGKRHRTPEEQQIIDQVAERKGREYAEEHAELILTQARLVGVI